VLLQAAAALAPSDVQVAFYRGLGDLPHFNPDHDVDPHPAPVRVLRAAVARADALLISSPEYAHGVPGSLKNALDWLVSGPEFPQILVALASPSPRSTYAQAALAETLKTMSGTLVPEAAVVIPVMGRQLSREDVLQDPALAEPLRRGMEALARAMRLAREENRRLVGPAPEA
jgi:NAD(P)H-dependent FMN reductase